MVLAQDIVVSLDRNVRLPPSGPAAAVVNHVLRHPRAQSSVSVGS